MRYRVQLRRGRPLLVSKLKGHKMQIFAIPVEDKFILYRPQVRLAFIGNRAMVDLAYEQAVQGLDPETMPTDEASVFLREIGFLCPDPPPLSAPGAVFRPRNAVLLLTNRCNLRCTYCYADGGASPVLQDMPLMFAKAAIDYVYHNARDMNAQYYELTFHGGGEPTQGWQILRAAVAYARAKDLPARIAMVSNGVWTQPQLAWILEHLDGVSVSYDGRPETQNHQRPLANTKGSFKTVMRTLEALDQANFSYGIRMTATAPWRGKLPEDVRFICEHTACKLIQVEPAFNTVRGTHRFPTSEEGHAFVEAFMEAFEIAGRAGRRLMYSGARPWLLTPAFCLAPYTALIVTPTGELVTCYEIASDAHVLAELSTIGRIEQGEIIVDHNARERLLTRLTAKREACRDCFCQWHCAGDCYTRAFDTDRGDFATPSPRCAINQEITKRLLLWYIMASGGVWRGQGGHPDEAWLFRMF